jgi:hypothetical protein
VVVGSSGYIEMKVVDMKNGPIQNKKLPIHLCPTIRFNAFNSSECTRPGGSRKEGLEGRNGIGRALDRIAQSPLFLSPDLLPTPPYPSRAFRIVGGGP